MASTRKFLTMVLIPLDLRPSHFRRDATALTKLGGINDGCRLNGPCRPCRPFIPESERMPPVTQLYLEDLSVGQVFGSGSLRVEENEIKAFASKFDPQPFHLDSDAARGTFFRELVASGWHTAAITMRLLVESEFKPVGGIVGAGSDELRWPRAVRPDDELRVEGEVLEVRPSKSRPKQGLIKMRVTTLNQNREAVQTMIANLVGLRRPNSQ